MNSNILLNAVTSAASSPEQVSSVETRIFDRSGQYEVRPQWVIRERAFTLHLNGREVITLLCAGHHLDELAVGFLYVDGFLKSPEDLENISVDLEAGTIDVRARSDSAWLDGLREKRAVTSGCGKGSLFYFALDALLSQRVEGSLRVLPSQVVARIEDLHRLSETYRHTHGVHNTALADAERVILFRDDIGRHNAVDMIAGHVLLNRISLDDKILLTTGRLTSEIIIKAGKIGLPMIVSRNTATTLAIELSRSLNITLVGYARAGKFTVYSGFERVASE